ncbi:MAG TPA: sulfatase [Gemmatimonadales bacterium]|jgi:arylsulfatase A-like enzyme
MPDSGPIARPTTAPWHPGDVLLAGAGFGLLAGGIEAVAALLREQVMHRTLFMGRDFYWQLPLADGVTLFGVALLFLIPSLVWPRLRTPQAVIFLFGSFAMLAVALLWEKIHPVSAGLLAVGIGAGLARGLAPRGDRLRRLLRLGVPGVLLLLLALAAGAWAARSAAERRRIATLPAARAGAPNVLLLVLDTARAWSMGLYGYRRPTTPNLRAWATRGTLFERTLAGAPWTTLSHAVMFTGHYPTELSVEWDRPLDASYPTLAQVLEDAGYATAGFVANYTQAGSPTGLDRGFLHYEDYPLKPLSILRRTGLWRRLFGIDRVAQLVGRRRMVDGLPATEVNARFLGWLERNKDRPWFAFLNYFEAHGPYLPPPPFEKMYMGKPDSIVGRYWGRILRLYGPPPVPTPILAESMDAYDGAITYLDAQIQALLLALSDRRLLSNTIVVVTSDHGELFGEHGIISHGNNLYLPVLHVPLLIIAPGRVPAGTTISSLTSLRDLPVTLLDLVGLANPGIPGHSLTRRWRAGAEPDTLVATLSYNRLLPRWPPSPILRGSMRTVILDSLQYILNGDGAEELYHLGQDSWQVRNLAALPAYRADLARYRAAVAAVGRH